MSELFYRKDGVLERKKLSRFSHQVTLLELTQLSIEWGPWISIPPICRGVKTSLPLLTLMSYKFPTATEVIENFHHQFSWKSLREKSMQLLKVFSKCSWDLSWDLMSVISKSRLCLFFQIISWQIVMWILSLVFWRVLSQEELLTTDRFLEKDIGNK